MIRRNFLKFIPVAGLAGYSFSLDKFAPKPDANAKYDSREYWISVLIKIIDPVLINLSQEKLKVSMPVECKPDREADRRTVTYLEAFGRTLAGISPWLELGNDNTPEGLIREKYSLLSRQCLSVAVNSSSPDYMNFNKGGQPLVDAAFLAHGLLRAYTQLWEPLDSQTKANIITALKATRVIKPVYSNWLLFSAMIETFFLKIGEDWDVMRVDLALKKHFEWYKGDGTYGDGSDFHWDYYNSYVIQPMMLDIEKVLVEKGKEKKETYQLVLTRAKRYATIQERMISLEGTFPPIGRSLAYRFGAFQLLSQLSLMKELPQDISPAQVRSALSLVINKMIEAPGTFDKDGWLTIGFCGHQPEIGEIYISTGSLYLCTVGLLSLGLPKNDPFWTLPAADWTQKKIWSGKDVVIDHAL